MNFFETLIASVTASTFFVGILAWLARSWISERIKGSIKSEYDQKLETHKAQLKASSDLEIERLKSNLTVLAKEREIMFSNMHGKQAEVVSEVYARLKQFHWDLDEYIKIFEPVGKKSMSERAGIAAQSHHKFIQYYGKNQIFLSKKSVKLIDSINARCKELYWGFKYEVEHSPPQQVDSKRRIEFETASKKDIPLALSELEEEFRGLLGNKN